MRNHAYNPPFLAENIPRGVKKWVKIFWPFYQLLIKYLVKFFQTEKLDFNLPFCFRSFQSLAVPI